MRLGATAMRILTPAATAATGRGTLSAARAFEAAICDFKRLSAGRAGLDEGDQVTLLGDKPGSADVIDLEQR